MSKIKNRSCKFCKWMGNKSLFVGKVTWCDINDREIISDGYCIDFTPEKK